MNKYTTIGQIKVNLKISLTKIIDFYSEINADEHGHAYLIVEMSKNTTITEIESLYLSSVSITDKHNENIFTGICVSTAIENQNGYQQLIIELLDHSVIADINRNTRTFQNPGKTLSDVLDEVFKQYSCCVNLKENPVIPSVVYQQNETDWQFALRMINSFGMHMYSGCRDKRISIAGGSKGGKSFSKSILDKQKSSSRNVGELRAVQLNADSTAAGYQYDSNEYTSANIMVKAGDIIGDYTVINNRIVNENGNFVNHLNLARTSDEKSSYSSSIEANIISNIITGTVISVSGNIVQVQFDADGADMSGNCVDIPYESAISNSFYCMPDIGDQVFVYYENNGKIVCLGSKRSSTDNPDFSKPEEKVLTNKDKMIRFTSSSLIVTDTRNKYDFMMM